jgi:hypothetical protein
VSAVIVTKTLKKKGNGEKASADEPSETFLTQT